MRRGNARSLGFRLRRNIPGLVHRRYDVGTNQDCLAVLELISVDLTTGKAFLERLHRRSLAGMTAADTSSAPDQPADEQTEQTEQYQQQEREEEARAVYTPTSDEGEGG